MPTKDADSDLLLKQFGERLKGLRLAHGLTQEELAAQAGFSRSYYTQIETGRRNVALLNLYRLAKCLQISLSDLLDIREND
ncbi:MAG: helix-turn-helix transcriptional regulator [Burkholderiales bacterium]|nr:helix-turn-helix transcriptional regulator [Anaerolineae bacterium]